MFGSKIFRGLKSISCDLHEKRGKKLYGGVSVFLCIFWGLIAERSHVALWPDGGEEGSSRKQKACSALFEGVFVDVF